MLTAIWKPAALVGAPSRRGAFDTAAGVLPLAATLAAAVFVAWHDRGSIAAADFLGPAIVVALVAAVAALAGATARPSSAVVSAAVCLLALAAWAGASAVRAPVPSLARDESLLEAFGVTSLLVAGTTLRRAAHRTAALATLAGGLALAALATAVHLHGSAAPADVFRFHRLSFPITYANAVAVFFLVGFWPAAVLAGRRGGSILGRALAGGAAAALLGAALLAQSKGAVLGLACSAVAVACVSPARLRVLLGAFLAAAPVAAAFGPLTSPYDAATTGAEVAAVHRAAVALVAAAIAGAALGGLRALAERRVSVDGERRRLVGRIVLAATVVALAGGGAAFVVATGHPGHWLDRQWHAFKHPESGGANHFVELGSNRYDFWRVALDEARRNPVVGGGARSFGPEYLAHGRSSETPARAHSLPLELLAEDGAVGLALAVAGFGILLVGLGRRARRRSAVATAAFAGCTLVLAQACVDWTFTFPAVTVPFFLLAGAGLAGDEPPPLGRRAARVSAGVCVAVAVLAFAPPWLSAKLTRTGAAHRDAADLRWARRLDPLSTDPLVAESRIAGSPAAALAPLERARSLAPHSVEVRYLLGMAYWTAHDRRRALSELEAARQLYPRSQTLQQLVATLRRG